ncbi:DUF835 domain-containing protein [Salinirubrum litoreum]|uniref:DUF835 domain-containing protein n=1 Tax=Salinirubrum litoreum TaxID=1126234 RepID=A0ABD5REM9_9EURY|nr:DUF835 domain-containing protein [Salinirubrum litoreum]
MPTHVSQPPIRDSLGEAATVLVESSSTDPDRAAVCTDLLHCHPTDRENLLWVTYTRGPDEKLSSWRRHADATPANLGVVSVGDTMRSAAAASAAVGGPEASGSADTSGSGPPNPVEAVENPSDLTGLGITVSRYFEAWGPAHPTSLCFDSITAMLQYVEFETAYRFLHVLTGRVATAGAVGHFHVDPAAHDDQTMESLKTLFDAVVSLDDDGRVVRTR